MNKIFDVHTHIYPEKISEKAIENLGDFYNYIPKRRGTLPDLEENCKAAGVSGFLLLTVATNAHQVKKINEYAASSAKKAREDGFVSFAFAGMHQDMPDEEKEAEVNRCAQMGISGFKLHPDFQKIDIDDKSLFPFYEMLCGKNLPVCFHMGDERPQYRYSEPRKLKNLLLNFPKLHAVAAHFGGYKAWDEAQETLSEFRGEHRLLFDTSSSLLDLTPERAAQLVDSFGEDNMMFGTDYPSLDAAGELVKIMRLPLSEAVMEKILWNNAARFLHFE